MKRVILIGGTGFLGQQVLNLLIKEKLEILVTEHSNKIPPYPNYEIIHGGIKGINTSLIDEFKPDAILHCARPTMPRFKKWGRMLAARQASKMNTKLIFDIKASIAKPKLIFASGSLLYGNSPQPHCETSAIKPISYARQYYKGERPLNKAVEAKAYNVMILRFPWLLGNGSWFRWFYLEAIKKHATIPKFGQGLNRMEVIDLEDAAKLMIRYAQEVDLSGVYNIVSEKPITQNEFLQLAGKVFNVTSKDYKKIFHGRMEKETIEAFTSDITLSTNYHQILDNFQFNSIDSTLRKIRDMEF